MKKLNDNTFKTNQINVHQLRMHSLKKVMLPVLKRGQKLISDWHSGLRTKMVFFCC